MGQSQSTDHPELYDFPPPVQTREGLTQRHADRIARSLGDDQRRWFEEVFNIFCDNTSKSTKFWSEKSLASFLQSTFPLELAAILLEAVPLIHRSLLRLGSFPYQNDPEELLTLRVLRTAVILVSGFVGDVDSAYFSSDEGRVCFQSMASLAPEKVSRDESLREESDDYDLIKVLSGMRGRRRHPDQPKVMIRGPEQPPPSQFPSSWSRDLNQFIPTNEFRSFLRTMVVLNLFSSGIDAQDFTTSIPQTEEVTDCLLAAFQAGPDGISWDAFGRVMKNDMPCLLLGLSRLLSPLVCLRPLPQGKYPSSLIAMQEFLRESFTPSAHREAPSSGSIFSLPILSQLGIVLPRYLLLEGMSVDWTVGIDQLDVGKLKGHINQTPPMVLLVSGNSQDRQVKFGLFFPKGSVDPEEKPCIFQLEPVHRAFWTPSLKKENVSIQVDLDENKNPLLTASITWKREPYGEGPASDNRLATELDTMTIVASEEGFGRFTVQTENYPKIDENFCVDAIELLKCDHQRVLVEDFDY